MPSLQPAARRSMLRTASVLVWALLTTGCATAPDAGPSAPPARPNVLFIAVDDLRPELGCYGATHVVSPNIDRLAAGGVLFERAYCQSAVCNPSRASLMTGKRPETIGVLDLRTNLRVVSPDVLTLPQHLRAHAWHTASIGKIYHNIFPDEPSWDERAYLPGFPFDPDAVYLTDEGRAGQAARLERLTKAGRADRALDRFGRYYLKAQATEAPDAPDNAYYDGAQTDWALDKLAELDAGDDPFFLAVGYYRPHLPFNAPKRFWDLYDRDATPLATGPLAAPVQGAPVMAINNMRELKSYTDFNHVGHPYEAPLSEDEQRLLKHGYLASVSYVDAQIGRLLDRLDELGLADNTIVVLWGDHGWKLGEHQSWGKMTNYEIDTRVPLLIRAPWAGPAGRRVNSIVEFVDIFPTLCELTGAPTPTDLEGVSLATLLREDDPGWKDTAWSTYLREGAWRGPDGREHIGRAIRTDRYRFVEWRERETGEVSGLELYDEREDPTETRNIAALPENATVVEQLRQRLR